MHPLIKKTLRLIFRIVLVLCLLVAGFAAWLMNGFRMQMNECTQGPLASISTCAMDHATFTWMGSGWWYNDATGPLKESVIQQLHDAPKAPIVIDKKTSVSPVDCRIILSAGDLLASKSCYASQRVSSNGNARYFAVLIVEKDAQIARYFAGAEYMLVDGKPSEVGRGVYPNIVENK